MGRNGWHPETLKCQFTQMTKYLNIHWYVAMHIVLVLFGSILRLSEMNDIFFSFLGATKRQKSQACVNSLQPIKERLSAWVRIFTFIHFFVIWVDWLLTNSETAVDADMSSSHRGNGGCMSVYSSRCWSMQQDSKSWEVWTKKLFWLGGECASGACLYLSSTGI